MVKLHHHNVDLHVPLKDTVMHEVVVQVVDTVMEATLQVTEEDLLHGAARRLRRSKEPGYGYSDDKSKHLLTGGQSMFQKAMFITTTQKTGVSQWERPSEMQ